MRGRFFWLARPASYNADPMNAAAQTIENPLQVDFCGLALNSPIVLLSGCVGFGEEYTRVEGFSNREVGAIVLKGTICPATLRVFSLRMSAGVTRNLLSP